MSATIWTITKREGLHPRELRSGSIIIRKGTTRGHYPMVKWRVIFPDKREAALRTLDEAKKYAEDNA